MLLDVLHLVFGYHAIDSFLVSELSIKVFSREQPLTDARLERWLHLLVYQGAPVDRTESRMLFDFIPIVLTAHANIGVSHEESLGQVLCDFGDGVSSGESKFAVLDEFVHQLHVLIVERGDPH